MVELDQKSFIQTNDTSCLILRPSSIFKSCTVSNFSHFHFKYPSTLYYVWIRLKLALGPMELRPRTRLCKSFIKERPEITGSNTLFT